MITQFYSEVRKTILFRITQISRTWKSKGGQHMAQRDAKGGEEGTECNNTSGMEAEKRSYLGEEGTSEVGAGGQKSD